MSIRTAIVGYGRNGSTMHAGGVAGNPAFEMVAVCDADPERRRHAVERFGCASYADLREMLAKERLDLAVIVTRSDQHCAMTCDCLSSGVNVLVSKPWATNEADALRMIETAKGSGRLLMPWLPARWGCDFQRLRQLIAEQAVGRVLIIRRTAAGFARRDDWQTERRYGGGYLLNWGPHLVEPPVLLMNGTVVSVYGRLMKAFNPGDGEDLFLAIMNLAGGTLIQSEYTVAVEKPPDWFIQGDRGTIVVRDKRLTIYRSNPVTPADPTAFKTMEATGDSIHEEILEGDLYGDTAEIYASVAAALQGRTPYPVTPQDALGLTRLLDAIRTAHEQNRVVTL